MPGRSKIVTYPSVQTGYNAHPTPWQWTGARFLGLKRPTRQANKFPYVVALSKCVELYLRSTLLLHDMLLL